MSEIPYWCSESPITGTYVATACPYAPDPLGEPVDKAGQLFGKATDAFLDWAEVNPLKLDKLDFATNRGWQGMAGQIVERYRAAHLDLVNSDPDYVDQLGEVYDKYHKHSATTAERPQSPRAKHRRHVVDIHHLVKEAAGEGIPTSVAAFGVVPNTVNFRKPKLTLAEQVRTSTQLLPAGAELSRHLALTSHDGNDHLLRKLAGITGFAPIPYGRLSYLAEAFAIGPGVNQREVLYTVGKHHIPEDLIERFRGCPAVRYGSVRKLNRFIMRTIIDNNCYERALVRA